MSNQFDWIKFWCWMWFMSILFFTIVFILFVLIYSTIKEWFINFDTALAWFSSPITLIISIFAYIFYCRKTSYIKIYPNSIVVKKHTHLWKITYEIYPWETEYANIETIWFTYSVYLKIKNQEEKILVRHIKDWDKLKDYFNSIWIITSERNKAIFNHKLWKNIFSQLRFCWYLFDIFLDSVSLRMRESLQKNEMRVLQKTMLQRTYESEI